MDLELSLPEPHETQAIVLSEAGRFIVIDCGRRWGKNVLLIDRLIVPAMERKPVAWFAPTYKMLADDWRELKGTLAPLIAGKMGGGHRITLPGGGRVGMGA